MLNGWIIYTPVTEVSVYGTTTNNKIITNIQNSNKTILTRHTLKICVSSFIFGVFEGGLSPL